MTRPALCLTDSPDTASPGDLYHRLAEQFSAAHQDELAGYYHDLAAVYEPDEAPCVGDTPGRTR